MKLVLIGLLVLGGSARAQTVELVGRSDKAAVLDVSPDGKWLLSWDGVTENTPATDPADRLVWNLTTKTARDISNWKEEKIYDIPCGWTPDNRIWQMNTRSQPLGDGNAPYTAEFFLENPDGSGKIRIADPNKKVAFDEQSYFDDVVSRSFSPDGKRLFVLSNSCFRIFDARSGKMLFRRRLRASERQEANLSLDGQTILEVTGKKQSDGLGPAKIINSGIWKLREARNGRLLRTLKAPKNAAYSFLSGPGIFGYGDGEGILFYGRLSDGKILWKRGPDRMRGLEGGMKALWVWNNENGRDQAYAAPDERKWRDLAISPDHKMLYGLTFEGEIYRCTAKEIKQ